MNSLRPLLAALPSLVTAGFFLATWRSPMSVQNGRWAAMAQTYVLYEFLSIHSGAFMGLLFQYLHQKFNLQLALAAGGLLLVYGIFSLGLAFAQVGKGLLILFWLNVLARCLNGGWGNASEFGEALLVRSFVSIPILLLCLFLAMVKIDLFPRWGMTQEALFQVNDAFGLRSGQEKRMLTGVVWASMHFTLVGLTEFWIPSIMRNKH